MKEPNWKTCTEEELWKFVAFHLAANGIDSILVGGAVVAIYTKGAYRSGDLDIIIERSALENARKVMEQLGFNCVRSRHYEHPKCEHLIVEFPPGPVSIGDDYKILPSETKVEAKVIKLFSPTDCIRDRLASYIHFNARECFDQAVMVGQRQPFDLNKVREWCIQEGGRDAFEEFTEKLKPTKRTGKK
jgi:hypothetical protein